MAKQCYFIDHTFVEAYRMAQLSAHVETNRQFFEGYLTSGMLLRTCHRVEFYFNERTSKNPFKEMLGCDSYTINDDEPTFLRLVEIACGTQSKIMGEKYIFEQVKRSADGLSDKHPFKIHALKAISIAKELREKTSFYAPIDYEQIMSMQLSSYLKNISNSNKLLVIGSGMLAKSIVEHAQREGLTDILIVSRVAKKLKKKTNISNKINICSISNVPEIFLKNNFHCFLATTDINEVYKEKLLSFISKKECLSVIDMSSLPAFNEREVKGKEYVTMYHEVFNKYVNENNELIKGKLENIKNEIALRCKKALH